jgi:hypothetical protein
MKKLNNKILLGALVVLAAIFVVARLFRAPGLESNTRKELVRVDTGAVSQVRVATATGEIALQKKSTGWTVNSQGETFEADAATVKILLQQIMSMRAERMVSRKKEKWGTFKVDSTATRVYIYQDGDLKADVYVGKTGFAQGGGSAYGGGAYTYVRLAGEDEVYTVNGFLESTFNRPADGWRNHTFLRVRRDDVTRIRFQYPDSAFVLEKKDSVWLVNAATANAASVDTYLAQLTSKNLYSFASDNAFATPPIATLVIEGKSGVLATVEGWPQGEHWALRSSAQKEAYFSSSGSSVVKDLLVGRGHFLKTP